MIARGNTCLRAQSAQHDCESNHMRFVDSTVIFGRQHKYSRRLSDQLFTKILPWSLIIYRSKEIYSGITKENGNNP